MYIEDRQREILGIIKKNGSVSVDTLVAQFGKSHETIRRDLRRLEKLGMVKRTHGGAELCESVPSDYVTETPLGFRLGVNAEKKLMIAKKAAEFVKNEDVILLDDSTTVSCMLRYLPRDYSLTIITNSILIVNQLQGYDNDANWTVVCLGGILRSKSCSLTGFLAVKALATFRPNKLFFSCGGIDSKGNLTEGNLSMVEVKREFLTSCKESYLLLDDSKIDNPTPVNLAEMRDVDYLIVSEADAKVTERIKKMGVKSIISV